MKKILVLLAALLFGAPAYGQDVHMFWQSGTGFTAWTPVSSVNPLPISGTIAVTFPTIGAAVPATGIYAGINVGGNLTGATGSTTAADNVTAPTGALDSRSFNYVWDGAAWDRLYGDSTNGLFANIKAMIAIPAGTANIGTVDSTGKTTTMATVAPTATVFSALLAPNAARKGCLIQNVGATLGYVYFGATGSATTSNSFQVAAGQSISCNSGPIVLTDNVAGTCASSTCGFIISSQ